MTDDRALKQTIRRRMQQTGEKYTDARRAVITPIGALQPGETRMLLVAWRLDDPAVQDDGRFWVKVPEELVHVHKRPAETILPAGQSLGSWRKRADGDEVELSRPFAPPTERISLERWRQEDPDRTHLIHSVHSRPGEQLAKRGVRGEIMPNLSAEAKRVKVELAELQRQFRVARDQDDQQRMAVLRTEIAGTVLRLQRADFPNFRSGWDFSRAIGERPQVFLLDWTTGY